MKKQLGFKCVLVISAGTLLWSFYGCSGTPDTRTAMPVEVPEAFSSAGTIALPDKWWQSFEDPALDILVEEGLKQNFSIRSTWDRLRQAEQVAAKAGASLLPSVTYEGAAVRTRRDTNDNISYSTAYTVGVAASYEVDLWGRVRSTQQAAALDAIAAREDVASAAITLSAAIAKTWYQLVEAWLQEKLVARQVETNEQVLAIITLQFRQGQVGAANIFRQRQLVESTRGQLINYQETAALLQHQLAILIGKTPGNWKPEVSDFLLTVSELPDTGVPSELLQRRPDLRSAQNAIAAADYRVSSAIADQYPRIGLSASAETNAARVRDLFDDWLASVAASAVGPVFDAGLRRAEVERTRAVLSERINTYAQKMLTAIGEVENAIQQEYYQRQSIANLQQQLVLAGQVSERTRESYLKGQVDYIRVLDALVSRQTLERNELSARRVLIDYRIDLCRSIAGGWELTQPKPATLQSEHQLTMRSLHE